MNKFSTTVVHSKVSAGDRNISIYVSDGDSFTKIAETPPNNAGDVEAIVDCPIDDGLIVRSLGIFRKTGATLVPWPTDIDSLIKKRRYIPGKLLGQYLA